LLELKGEATSVAIAEEILALYQRADPSDKMAFFHFLHEKLGSNSDRILTAIKAYQASPSQAAAQDLAKACEASRRELLRTLNIAADGTQALIDMREDLHKLMRDDPAYAVLDRELLGLFQSWFNRGFLKLRSIDWNTPALILEKLIQYDSVHEIQGWPDLRRRLARDRGCFGFFHPAIPDVPLIFVEAALTRGISTNITELLQQEPPEEEDERLPDTAVFYSINNCLQGLRGVSFGSFLIKQVIERLSAELPHIQQFVTLSPVPGFMRWLHASDSLETLLEDKQLHSVQDFLQQAPESERLKADKDLREALLFLCAHYLVNEKSRGNPADSVARFHLGNGARLEQINWLADSSGNGLQQAAGLMVNYVYDRKQLARNHEAYEQRREVACSATIRKLL
jgi:malonyl-CoA decarboxylase